MVISLLCPECNPQSTHAPPRRDRGCQNTCFYIPIAYIYRSGRSRKQSQLALSKLENLCWKGKCKLMESTKNPAPRKAHHESHISPATATTSRQAAKKRVPHVGPYSPASIDPGFEEIGLVQLSQLVKTTNVTHTHRDRLLNNGNLYAPRYEEAFLP